MYNWSVDERELLRKDKKRYAVWKLEQMVNFGLGGKKIDAWLLKKYWNVIAIDPSRRKFLALLLYGTNGHSHAAPARRARGGRKR
ncbi:hypothetical protein HY250_01590 [Candidatus Azambacteria bacterium]|nr:hypothetical protein [Candidatus Azambacteria bacterium]MBI3685073.1 hypothetical protein [Candidatus Azambacteria bacterium]